MSRLWIISGILLLLSVLVINRYLKLRKTPVAGADLYHIRIKPPRKCLRLLHRAEKLRVDSPALEALHSCGSALAEHVVHLRKTLAQSIPLPEGDDGHPRLMLLAHTLSDEGLYTTEELLHAVKDWPAFPLTSSETEILPQCIAAAQCMRLRTVVRTILMDAQHHRAAERIFCRLKRSRQPKVLLDKHPLSSAGLAALYEICLRQDTQLLSCVDAHIKEQELSPDALVLHYHAQQSQLIDELHRALDCFSRLERMDWSSRCEAIDPLHPLLLQDPAAVYPQLEAACRARVRRQVDAFSRRTRMDAQQAADQALTLARSAHGITPHDCVCWYFLEADGLRSLHRALSARKGWLWARLSQRQNDLSYTFLLCFGLITGFFFLHSRHPVFMLPFFAWVSGCISRAFVRLFPKPRLMHMALPPLTDDLRTLVVLPAVLPDPAAALQAVQSLRTALRFFPQEAHFLLLGDYAPCITAVSGSDADILQTAAAAIDDMADPRIFYLQRGRTWDSTQHCYCSHSGSSGILFDLCRMITHGECPTPIAYSTADPSFFERKYAYILLLPPQQLPMPGLLEQLMSTMIFPLYTRLLTPDGWRGVSILSPQGMGLSDGMALIRPDAFQEATDSLISPASHADALCEVLAGHACVPELKVNPPQKRHSWEEQFVRVHDAWKLLPWLFPHVQTPSGLIPNPLRFFSKFRLRERMRATLVPLGQLALMLWAVLTSNWLLLLLAFAAPEVGNPLRCKQYLLHMFRRFSLLPTTMAVSLLGASDAIFRKRMRLYDFRTLEVWAQGVTATIFAALSIALPGGSLSALLLAALFAAFPLAHK